MCTRTYRIRIFCVFCQNPRPQDVLLSIPSYSFFWTSSNRDYLVCKMEKNIFPFLLQAFPIAKNYFFDLLSKEPRALFFLPIFYGVNVPSVCRTFFILYASSVCNTFIVALGEKLILTNTSFALFSSYVSFPLATILVIPKAFVQYSELLVCYCAVDSEVCESTFECFSSSIRLSSI